MTVVQEQKENHISYSSTKIRQLLQEGNITKASQMLGYWWRVSGKVESGAQKRGVVRVSNSKYYPFTHTAYMSWDLCRQNLH